MSSIRTQLHGMTRGQRAGECYPKNYNYQSIYGGQYFNFKELPEDIWGDIATEVKEYICG